MSLEVTQNPGRQLGKDEKLTAALINQIGTIVVGLSGKLSKDQLGERAVSAVNLDPSNFNFYSTSSSSRSGNVVVNTPASLSDSTIEDGTVICFRAAHNHTSGTELLVDNMTSRVITGLKGSISSGSYSAGAFVTVRWDALRDRWQMV